MSLLSLNCDNLVTVRKGSKRCMIDVSTSSGRKNQGLLIIAVSLIPVLGLLIQKGLDLYQANDLVDFELSIKEQILYSVKIENVIHRLQIERGLTTLFASSEGRLLDDDDIYEQMLVAYPKTDSAILNLTWWVTEPDLSQFVSAHVFLDHIHQFRMDFSSEPKPNRTEMDVLGFYTKDIGVMQNWVGVIIQHSQDGDLWRTLMAYYLLILGKEQVGLERALGSTFYATGNFSTERYIDYSKKKMQGNTFIEQSAKFSTYVAARVKNGACDNNTNKHVARMRKEIESMNNTDPDVRMGWFWFANMTIKIDSIKTLQDALVIDIINHLNDKIEELQRDLRVSVCVMVVAILLFPFIVITVNSLTQRIRNYAHQLQERTEDLDRERQRSLHLLHELLPVSVAKLLLNGEEVQPLSFPSVTILFSDIVDFTAICSSSTPLQIIDMLNDLYNLFDEVVDDYDVYKVETIGDEYMVSSGLPMFNPEHHASEMAGLALDLRLNLSRMKVESARGKRLFMRIGLSSGPVVAGVVGHKMPRYCVFGDTVNVAARMQSTGKALQIQISGDTHSELEKLGGFIMMKRGELEIKGRGTICTHWLVGRQPGHVDDFI